MDEYEFEVVIYITQYQYEGFWWEDIKKWWIVCQPVINKLFEETNLKLG